MQRLQLLPEAHISADYCSSIDGDCSETQQQENSSLRRMLINFYNNGILFTSHSTLAGNARLQLINLCGPSCFRFIAKYIIFYF